MTFQIAVYLEGYIESVHQGLEELCHLMRDNVLQKAQIFSSENKEKCNIAYRAVTYRTLGESVGRRKLESHSKKI